MAATRRKARAGSLAPLRARLRVVRPPAPPPPLPASAPPRPPPAPEWKPAAGRRDLGATPLTRAAPPGAKLVFGQLVCQVAKNGRPLVGLEVPCPCRFPRHRSPWRGDWPVSRAVARFPLSVCPGREGQAVWLAFNPATLGEQEATLRQARGVPGVAAKRGPNARPGRRPAPPNPTLKRPPVRIRDLVPEEHRRP